jgi:hypothetical protein
LIGTLQQHLALPDGANQSKDVVEAATPTGEPSEKKTSSGWFGRLFRAT